ncbi:MAG: hypothetical protein C0412_21315, partial [Flavobacterium sp.]|nr:hypothetical protein [Flavobacterium sp.]
DGRSVYVSAGFINKAKFEAKTLTTPLQFYLDTRIYLMSYNEGATSETVEIFNRMVANWKFNTNVTIESGEEIKLRNDVKRWADINNIKILLENYKTSHGYYPKLKAGTYVANHTVSTWPSWQYELGKELGSFLLIDPINKFGPCPPYSKFDPITCWDKEGKKYAGVISDYTDPASNIIIGKILNPVPDSFVYIYSSLNNGQDYSLGYETEFGKGCEITQCFVNNSCVEVGTCHPSIPEQYCQLGNWVNHCGNGTEQCGEECEIEDTRNYCDTKYGDQQWNKEKIQTCPNCVWEAMTYTEVDCGGYCGDNLIQADYEQCEINNFITPTSSQAIDVNHQYECSTCKLTGGWCGDKVVQTNHAEQCDDENKINTDHCNNVCEIKNQNPIVILGADLTKRVGTLVNINGNASDPDGDLLTYLWEIISKPERSVLTLSKYDTLDTSFTPDKAGEYELKLSAEDNFRGEGSDSITITAQTYCGDNEVQSAGPYHEGITEECEGQNGLEGYQCIGVGIPQCDVSCKVACTDNGTPAKCGSGTAKLYGEISNTMSPNKISGAKIEIKDSLNKPIASTTTDVNGNYTFENLAKSFSPTETLCGYKMTVSKDGFQPGEVELNFENELEKNFALTPKGLESGTKIILKWGAEPADLDAHLEFEADNEIIHIYHGNMPVYNGASLDIEDKDGEGPETITIDPFVAGSTYKYYVHNFSGTSIFSSMPVVQIVDANSNVLYEFSPIQAFTEYWYIFDIDGSTGNITKKNGDQGIIQDEAPGDTEKNNVEISWEPEVRLTNDSADSLFGMSNGWTTGVDAQNRIHTAWMDKRNGHFEMFYNRSLDGGATWGSNIKISNNPDTGNVVAPSLAVSTNGYIHIIWAD